MKGRADDIMRFTEIHIKRDFLITTKLHIIYQIYQNSHNLFFLSHINSHILLRCAAKLYIIGKNLLSPQITEFFLYHTHNLPYSAAENHRPCMQVQGLYYFPPLL